MFKTHASYKNGNRELVAVSYDGVYSVLAYENGVLIGAHDTADLFEAMEVFAYNYDLI